MGKNMGIDFEHRLALQCYLELWQWAPRLYTVILSSTCLRRKYEHWGTREIARLANWPIMKIGVQIPSKHILKKSKTVYRSTCLLPSAGSRDTAGAVQEQCRDR